MRNRKGFTLMELLLVVAVLAIVAAAAAPTFFSGASEAMNEARKSSFMAAYTNASSAANMNAALLATGAKEDGVVVTKPSIEQLRANSPLDTRIFTNNAGNFGLIFAEYESGSIVVKYTALTDKRPTADAVTGTAGTKITDVSAAWTNINKPATKPVVKYTALTDKRPTADAVTGTAGTKITDVSAAWTNINKPATKP